MQNFPHQEQHNVAPAVEDNVDLYELDAGSLHPTGLNGNGVPRTISPGEWRQDHRGQEAVRSDDADDEDLAKAIELSQQEAFSARRRISTGGFDEDQIVEALNRSLLISGRS
jgi:hypothetical protein